MIDVSKIIATGHEIFLKNVQQNPTMPREEVFEKTYASLLESFLELLVSEFFKGFKQNIKEFSTQLGNSFEVDLKGASKITEELTSEYIITEEGLETNFSKLRFLQKDKNNFLTFMSNMQRDLTENKIDQFIAFYSLDEQVTSIRTCCKVTNWIEMVGMLEAMKMRIMNQYQPNMLESK